MSKIESRKYFDSLLNWIYDEYNRKNKYDEKRHKEKITTDNFKIPQTKEFDDFLYKKYTLPQLKNICEEFDLKISGNKDILTRRIFSYLYLSIHVAKIQKLARKLLAKKYILTHGPAYNNRSSCVNHMDFYTMDEMKEIVPSQFFSFKDEDNFVYGFDIISFHNLIQKTESLIITNPYTKQQIPSKVIMQFKELKRLSLLLRIPINLRMDSMDEPLIIKSASQKAHELFAFIDSLGNYTNVDWFMQLAKDELLALVMELFDLWYIRAELSHATHVKICHPNGNPFTNDHLEGNQTILNYLKNLPNLELLKSNVLDILDKVVRKGINIEYNRLGAYYVLGALTLVNNSAARALPWLYESVAH